jgi:anti-sigma factor ChrR (cupin superfamily)
MSWPSRTRACEHAELTSLYALQALPSNEAQFVEFHVAECTDCRDELDALRPLIASFVSWPTDVLRPSVLVWERLARRIGAGTGAGPVEAAPPRWVEPDWKEVAPGIFCKLLATDMERHRVSMLVRLAPGVEYPPHRHAGLEELHLLDGELLVDEQLLHPGDYIRAEAGTTDARVWSETGCTCVLVTSIRDQLR